MVSASRGYTANRADRCHNSVTMKTTNLRAQHSLRIVVTADNITMFSRRHHALSTDTQTARTTGDVATHVRYGSIGRVQGAQRENFANLRKMEGGTGFARLRSGGLRQCVSLSHCSCQAGPSHKSDSLGKRSVNIPGSSHRAVTHPLTSMVTISTHTHTLNQCPAFVDDQQSDLHPVSVLHSGVC